MAPKKKPDQSGYVKLKKDLSDKMPGNLYILHGEETYLRDYYLDKLRNTILTDDMSSFNLHQLSSKDISPHKLEEVLNCLPMMAERTFVLVVDVDIYKANESDREQYMTILNDIPDYCCLVFLYDLITYKADARTKMAAVIKSKGEVVNFIRQEQGDLTDWVRRRFRAMHKEIDSRLALEFIFLCGDLMQNLVGEIEKVGSYAKFDKITREDINAVATPQLDAVVFQMTDCIGQGNFDRAMAVLGELYQMQEPPIKIMWSLSRQMRQIYSARLIQERNYPASQVASLWGLTSYPAEKIAQSARRFSLTWCRHAVVRCGETDHAMKSTGQDGQALLTALLLELAVPIRG